METAEQEESSDKTENLDENNLPVYWEEKPDTDPTFQTEDVSPKDRLAFAKSILFGLFLLVAISMILVVIKPSSGQAIFEFCKTALPPIATLVLGYYFGRNN